jgi:hypothetical protein
MMVAPLASGSIRWSASRCVSSARSCQCAGLLMSVGASIRVSPQPQQPQYRSDCDGGAYWNDEDRCHLALLRFRAGRSAIGLSATDAWAGPQPVMDSTYQAGSVPPVQNRTVSAASHRVRPLVAERHRRAGRVLGFQPIA